MICFFETFVQSVIAEVEDEDKELEMPDVPYRRVAFVEPEFKARDKKHGRRSGLAGVRLYRSTYPRTSSSSSFYLYSVFLIV